MKKIVIILLVLIFSVSCLKKEPAPAEKSPLHDREVGTWVVFEKLDYSWDNFETFVNEINEMAQAEWSEDARLQIVSSIIDKEVTDAQYFFNFYSQVKKDEGKCANLFVYYNDQYSMGAFGKKYQIHNATNSLVKNQKLFAYTPLKPEVCENSEVDVGQLDSGLIKASSMSVIKTLKENDPELKPNSKDGNNYLLMMIPAEEGQYWQVGNHKISSEDGDLVD